MQTTTKFFHQKPGSSGELASKAPKPAADKANKYMMIFLLWTLMAV